MNIGNILEMATLPSQIQSATAMGGAEAEIVTTVAEQLKESFKGQQKTVGIKEKRELLGLYKDECSAFGEKATREGFTKWLSNQG